MHRVGYTVLCRYRHVPRSLVKWGEKRETWIWDTWTAPKKHLLHMKYREKSKYHIRFINKGDG